jgi:hypothetical protein
MSARRICGPSPGPLNRTLAIWHCPTDNVPYPWGPRLDALSVFCMRRFGWMELGFTRDYLLKIARATGWVAKYHPFPGCGRASIYMLEPAPDYEASRREALAREAARQWSRTRPVRSVKYAVAEARGAMRKLRG